jgi:hypothetical protein
MKFGNSLKEAGASGWRTEMNEKSKGNLLFVFVAVGFMFLWRRVGIHKQLAARAINRRNKLIRQNIFVSPFRFWLQTEEAETKETRFLPTKRVNCEAQSPTIQADKAHVL